MHNQDFFPREGTLHPWSGDLDRNHGDILGCLENDLSGVLCPVGERTILSEALYITSCKLNDCYTTVASVRGSVHVDP